MWSRFRRVFDVLSGRPASSFEYLGGTWPDEPDARGWDVEDVARRQVEQLTSMREPSPGTDGRSVPSIAPSPALQNAYLSFAHVLATAMPSDGALKVLDLGGGVGHYFEVARRLFPDAEFDYHVAELPTLCDAGTAVTPDATFHPDRSWTAETFDVAMAIGSIQYVSDWRGLVADLLGVATGWAYVARTPVVMSASGYVTLQHAAPYYDTEYLGWVLDRGDLVDTFEAHGATPVLEFTFDEAFHVPGAPEQPIVRGWLLRLAG